MVYLGPTRSFGPLFGDTLSSEGKQLPQGSLVLANPPFGTKMGGGLPTRDDLVHYTSNKQLAFLHLIYHKLLKPGGRAAVVLPDNVLFEGSTGKTIRQDLMDKCNLHTILRLPTGIFYAMGVKTNVLFFTKPKDPKQDKGNTKNVWVYDLRANMPQFGKRITLEETNFEDFINCFGKKADGSSQRTQNEENERWRCFSREEIASKEDSLDLAWIRNEDSEDADNLLEPDVLVREAIVEMAGAINDLQAILVELGVEEEVNEVVL